MLFRSLDRHCLGEGRGGGGLPAAQAPPGDLGCRSPGAGQCPSLLPKPGHSACVSLCLLILARPGQAALRAHQTLPAVPVPRGVAWEQCCPLSPPPAVSGRYLTQRLEPHLAPCLPPGPQFPVTWLSVVNPPWAGHPTQAPLSLPWPPATPESGKVQPPLTQALVAHKIKNSPTT